MGSWIGSWMEPGHAIQCWECILHCTDGSGSGSGSCVH